MVALESFCSSKFVTVHFAIKFLRFLVFYPSVMYFLHLIQNDLTDLVKGQCDQLGPGLSELVSNV